MDSIANFTRNNRFLMLALDHRQSFQKLLNLASQVFDPEAQTRRGEALQKEMVEAKYQIIKALYDQFSGILLDPQFGLPAYKNFIQRTDIENSQLDSVKRAKPYLLSIEKTGYTDSEGERVTELEYSVAELKHMGATGIKILLYFHPDAHSVVEQLETAREVLSQCQKENLPLFLEIVTYDLEGQKHSKEELIPRSVQLFLEQEVISDVFKLEYPGSEHSCKKITDILGSTPWILLTRGVSFDQFKQELQIASQNGAQGFLAGRSIWQDFTHHQGSRRIDFLSAVVKNRFQQISEIVLK